MNNPDQHGKKTLRTFAAASFLNDMGSDIIYPIWPLFVTGVLGANMAVLGFIDGLGEAVVSISQAASGYISDRIKRRKVFIWIGYVCGAASRIGYGLSTVWQHLIPFRILDRAGKMRGAPRDALLAEISTDENRGGNFGLLRTMDNLGAVCGIVLCLLLFDILGYRYLFMLAAIPSLLAAVLIFLSIKEQKSGRIQLYKGVSLHDLSGNLKLFIFLSALFAIGSFSYSFLLIFAKEYGFKASFVPVLYLIFTIVASLFSIAFGRLSDMIGRKNVLLISYVFWAIVCIIFLSSKTYWMSIIAFVFYGLHKSAFDPVQKTLVAELAPREFKASTLGGFQMVIGLCALPASLIAGIAWDTIGMRAPLYISLALTAASTVLLFFVKEPYIAK